VGVVVTGAGGYVGGRLVQHLGDDAVPTLRTPVPWLPDAVVADLRHDDLGPLLGGADAVVHLAGASEVAFGREPDRAREETLAATRRVAEATAEAGVPRLVYLSTFHVYGGRTDDGVVHEDVVPEPIHPYAASRLEGEGLAAGLGPEHVVTLRLTNSIGPPVDPRVDRWTLVANDLCRQVVAGADLHPRDGGRALRDFVDLGEACRVIALAAGGALPADTYNLGSGVTRSILDLAELIADAAEEVLGRRPAVAPEPDEGAAPQPYRVAIGRLASWVPPPEPDLRPALVDTLRLLG
jgi:UDP-glucose 4-epimerase